MNILIPVLLAALILWAVWSTVKRSRKGGGCCGEREETVRKRPAADRSRAHYPFETTLQIGGMTCENCARKVENALNALPDTWASVDISAKTARIRTKTEPDRKQLTDAVLRAGYVVLDEPGL